MINKKNLPVLESMPLVDFEMPQVGFLGGDEGMLVHKEVQGKYGQFPSINNVNYKDSLVNGSTPFYVVAVNEIIRANGLRTATPADLEKILRLNALDLADHYEDSALALRSENAPNAYLAKHLIAQLKARSPELKLPVMLPLAGLSLVRDQNSDYGLAFELCENSEVIYAPILNKEDGNFSSEDIDESIGLPKNLGKGPRTLYTRQDGASRFCLSLSLNLGSGDGDLANSGEYGRVVVVSGEATSQKFLEYAKEAQKARESYVSKLTELEAKIREEREALQH